MIRANIIADSKNPIGNRITTFLLVMPRIILAEFNTHRMLSRNSASSRAIPFEKMVKAIQENPFIPIKWMKDHKGMQGTDYFDDPGELHSLEHTWLYARASAIERAVILHNAGLSKQICNRLLEPFMYHTVIATGTEWENFFALRAHPSAEIHMQDLAFKMLHAYNKSVPKSLNPGEWHIPFGDLFNDDKAIALLTKEDIEKRGGLYSAVESIQLKVATARCARISYTQVGESQMKEDYVSDIKLHDRLVESGHWSPFEHCAKVIDSNFNSWSGNFKGFIQYRKLFTNENKVDSRVIK